ncbi:hypothetical protein CPAV1605_1043 [seawater metagenome]|uniref:Uncharacterized protein n=1 Tax=seawater metagenome TaxID=1561972 RepID=A0A5E8CLT5_9ZZZZ
MKKKIILGLTGLGISSYLTNNTRSTAKAKDKLNNLDGIWSTQRQILYEEPNQNLLENTNPYIWINRVSSSNLFRVIQLRSKSHAKIMIQSGADNEFDNTLNSNYSSSTGLMVASYNKYSKKYNITHVDSDDTTIEQFDYFGENEISSQVFETGNFGIDQKNSGVGNYLHQKITKEDYIEKITNGIDFEEAYKIVWQNNHSQLSATGPEWTFSNMEPPKGEESQGSYKIAVYTEEQQDRLNIDKYGKKKKKKKRIS